LKKKYTIEVDCANCANKMEQAIKKISGIKDASINFMTQKLMLEFSEGVDTSAIMKQVITACKKVESDCEIYL